MEKVAFPEIMLLPEDPDICKGKIRYMVGWVVTDKNKVTSKKPKLVSSLICMLCKGGRGISPAPLASEGAQGDWMAPKRGKRGSEGGKGTCYTTFT